MRVPWWLGRGATRSQLVQVEAPPAPDTTAPISSIACDASACSSGWYGAPVIVTLAATDDFFSYRRNTLQGVRDYGRGLSAIALED